MSTAAMSHTAEDLSSITGAEHTLIANESVLVSPEDTNQVASILSYAQKHHLTVAPCCGRTKQGWGGGGMPHIYLSLSRLNRLIRHPWQDLTCSVQAGCTWSSLQRALATHGQFVALDPLFREHASVGGVLATDDSGALRQRYGSLRDLVIGMTLVLPDGTIARTGGNVVKNVAGYDLCKLITGSLGTLAVITEANFRLHPLPRHTRHFTIAAQQAAHLAPLVAAIRSSHLLMQSLQLRRTCNDCHLDVCLNAHPEANQDAILAQMTKQEGLTLAEVSDDIWRERESLFAPNATVLRIATLPAEVCVYADSLQTSRPGVEIRSVSQAIGIHDVALQGVPDAVATTIRELRADAAPHTTISILQAGSVEQVPALDIASPVLSLMKAIKHQFDPESILNPGKLFAGA